MNCKILFRHRSYAPSLEGIVAYCLPRAVRLHIRREQTYECHELYNVTHVSADLSSHSNTIRGPYIYAYDWFCRPGRREQQKWFIGDAKYHIQMSRM